MRSGFSLGVLLAAAGVACGDAPDPPPDRPPGPEAVEATLLEGEVSAGWARVIANSSTTEDFNPRTRAELDELGALGDRLVAIAVSNPGSEVARKIRLTLSIAGDPRDAGHPRCTGAYDILQRIYEVPYGEVRVEDGKLVFDFAEPPPAPRAGRAVTNVPSSLYFGRYDQMSEPGEVLRAAGFIKVPCDRGHPGRVTIVDGTVGRMTRNWSDAVSVRRRRW